MINVAASDVGVTSAHIYLLQKFKWQRMNVNAQKESGLFSRRDVLALGGSGQVSLHLTWTHFTWGTPGEHQPPDAEGWFKKRC